MSLKTPPHNQVKIFKLVENYTGGKCALFTGKSYLA